MAPLLGSSAKERYQNTSSVAFPSAPVGQQQQWEWCGNRIHKGLILFGFSRIHCNQGRVHKSLKSMTFLALVVVIERGGLTPSLSQKPTNQRSTRNAGRNSNPYYHRHSERSSSGKNVDPCSSHRRLGIGTRDAASPGKLSAVRRSHLAVAASARLQRTDLSARWTITKDHRFPFANAIEKVLL